MEIFVIDSHGVETRLEKGQCMFHALGFGFESFSGALHVKQMLDEHSNLPRVVMRQVLADDSKHNISPMLGHARRCPAMEMHQQGIVLQQDGTPRNVSVACCVVLERRNPRTRMPEVLITRRHPLMRAFPFLWVFPGGHVDPHEQLWQAGVRELEEETGIKLDATRESLTLLGFWESIYPSRLEVGPLRKQHLVAFFHYQLPECHNDVEINLCPVEVDAAGWLGVAAAAEVLERFGPRDTAPLEQEATKLLIRRARDIFGVENGEGFSGKALTDSAASHAGDGSGAEWNDCAFTVEESLTGENVDIGVERMSTATVFTLSLWLTLALEREERNRKASL